MTNDGTQDPGPQPVLSDPVSGLVTGSGYAPEPLKVRVVEPPMPDISAVRAAMAGMLDEDSELNFDLVQPAETAAERTTEIPVQASSPENAPPEPQAEVPAPAAPVEDPAPTPPVGIPAQQTAEPATSSATVPPQQPRAITPGNVEKPRRLPARFRRKRPPKPATAMGRKSSAPSIAAIAVLLLVIAVLAIVLIASFIDTIGSIFA
ncbi:MAG TPA: hypothetical protein VHH15_16375 [Actinophytocola sp.]|nr:hypothetical protein [Actinophytocola sp.]